MQVARDTVTAIRSRAKALLGRQAPTVWGGVTLV